MSVPDQELPQTIQSLIGVIPVLLEKEKQGLIQASSHRKAESLVAWCRFGRALTPKQEMLVGRLLARANRRHRKGAPITVNTVNTVDVAAVAEKVKGLIALDTIDQTAVVEEVIKRMEARTPRPVEITVRVEKPDGKTKTKKIVGPRHEKFEHLMRIATAKMDDGYAPNVFMAGESSSGKTTGARQLAEALGREWYYNGAISFAHEMLGFVDGNGKYHRTPFRDAYEHGGVYTFDEVDRSNPVALLGVNPHLAGFIGFFPDKKVVKHKDCIITATANTWGLGADANYSGATKLDAAFMSRFHVNLPWDIDEKLEDMLVGNPDWLKMLRTARYRARAVGMKVLIDTRAAQAGAALIKAGYSLDEAAQMTYLAKLKPDQRSQLS